MRNRFSTILWGVVFILAGLCFAGNALNLWDFTLFFDGWWTLFIIIPSIVNIIQSGFKMSSMVGLIIGVVLLLAVRNIIRPETVMGLIVPAILVLIGIKIIFRDHFNKSVGKIKSLSREGIPEYTATFSGHQENFYNEKFNGANINAIFGGVDLNLKNAIVDTDVIINGMCVFGGINIFVPPNVRVKVSSIPLFGGVSNRAMAMSGDNSPTIYLNATCIFGGIDIK